MKKRNIVKKKQDYNGIIGKYKPYKYKEYIIYIERIEEDNYYFGFSVGKKIGNAVVRNKIKRQIKNILDKKVYKNGFNCIIIVRKGILDKNYKEMQNDLWTALEKLELIKGDKK